MHICCPESTQPNPLMVVQKIAYLQHGLLGADDGFERGTTLEPIKAFGIKYSPLGHSAIGEFDAISVGIEDHTLVVTIARHVRSLQNNTPGSLKHRGQPVDFLGRIGREGDVSEAGELAVNVIEAARYGRHLHDLETRSAGEANKVGSEVLRRILVPRSSNALEILNIKILEPLKLGGPKRNVFEGDQSRIPSWRTTPTILSAIFRDPAGVWPAP